MVVAVGGRRGREVGSLECRWVYVFFTVMVAHCKRRGSRHVLGSRIRSKPLGDKGEIRCPI